MNQKDYAELRGFLEDQLRIYKAADYEVALSPCADENELASKAAEASFNLCMRGRVSRAAHEIESALKRMDFASYGRCLECGADIGLARLRARPAAELCVECQAEKDEAERAGLNGRHGSGGEGVWPGWT